MTRARDIANLVDANGDIVAGALDNVPAADLVNDTTPQLGGALDAQGNNMTSVGDVSLGGGRTTPATSGGVVLSDTGINNDIVSNGRSAGLLSTWASLRIHPDAAYSALRIVGDTSQSADYMKVVDANGNNVMELDSSRNLSVNGHIYGNDGNAKLQLGFDTIYTNSGMSLTTTATDTYVNSSNLLDTGAYIIRVHVTGGGWYSEAWSGIMSWYAGSTNSNDADDMYMQGMGHAANGRNLYARVRRRGGNNHNHSIQIWTNSASSGSTVHIDAKRLF